MLARASNIGPVRVNHKVSTTGDGTRKQGDVEIQNFPLSLCDSLVIDVSFLCEFAGSSCALGGCNNNVRHTNDILKARATVQNNKYSEAYGLVAFAPAIVGMSGQIHADFLRLQGSGFSQTSRCGRTMRAWVRKITSKMRRSGGRGPRLSTPTRLPLVGPLLLAASPVVICLCIVLRYLARFQMMTLVEVVLGRVLLGVVHAGADAVPREMRTFPRGGGFRVCTFSRCFCGPWR